MKVDKKKLESDGKERTILLVLLPFWTTLIPPLGISCLKSYLQKHGFIVKAVDANIVEAFREIYDNYFEVLKDIVPASYRGNFYNTGHDVLRHHLMVHLNLEDKKQYFDPVKSIVFNYFFQEADAEALLVLDQLVGKFFLRLEEYICGLIRAEKPSVLGLSVYNGNLPASLFGFKTVKQKYPHITTVMGGGVFADQLAGGTPNFQLFLKKTPYIDKIIIGEGEQLFLKWLIGELDNSRRVYSLKDVETEPLDLSSIGVPDFSDFDLQHYPSIAAYGSRSCPFRCAFCSETVQWGSYRKKSAGQIVEDLGKLRQRYGFQLFLMGDSLLNPIIDALAAGLLREKWAVYWDGYLRVGEAACCLENALAWRRGGFYRARLGVESGSQQVLDSMNKKISIRQIKETIRSLASVGIKTTTYWVIGFPGETEDDFQQTLELLGVLKDDIYEADCNPFNFFLGGQVNSAGWANRAFPLFPEWAEDLLIAQPWTLDGEPNRREVYRRICRFMSHSKRLGIPNPYSLQDISRADERWKKLHKNSVPSLLDFQGKDVYIDECKGIQQLLIAPKLMGHDGDWGF
jgi:hypothetical protein